MSDHIFCDSHVVVDLAIVYLEFETDKVGEDGGRSCLRSDGRNFLAWLGTDNWETSGDRMLVNWELGVERARKASLRNDMWSCSMKTLAVACEGGPAAWNKKGV